MILNYKKYGDQGENLIILHGLFGMLDNWHTVASDLAKNFQVYALDLRNHGKSPHSDEFSYSILAADLNDFFIRHNLPKAHLIGHSMGGKAAMQFAFLHPQKVGHLIVVDIAPKAYDPRHDRIIKALLSLDLSKIENRRDAEDMLLHGIPDLAERQFLLKSLMREGAGFQWKFNLSSLAKNYHLISGAINSLDIFEGPTLFIRGSNSNYILDQDMPSILQQFPHARLITLSAGHWVHAEAPQQFLDTVRTELMPKYQGSGVIG